MDILSLYEVSHQFSTLEALALGPLEAELYKIITDGTWRWNLGGSTSYFIVYVLDVCREVGCKVAE